MRACLQRLHREERAQVSFLAVAAALCFVGLLAMVINTNDLVRERVRMQEVADVSALSAATWHARGMNMVSMINVLNSKLLSMTVLVNSIHKTLPIIDQIAGVQIGAFTACSAVPVVGAFCAVMAAVVKAQKVIIAGMIKVFNQLQPHTKCKAAVWKAMSSLQKVSEGVRLSFANIGTASSLEIATANGASFGIALNGGLLSGAGGLTLPVSADNRKQADFCSAMKAGGPGYVMEGYANNQGPVRLGKKIWDIVFIPFVNLLPHPIFYGFYTFYMNQIGCKPDPNDNDNGAVETHFDFLGECRKYNAQATWQNYEARTGWVNNGGWTKNDFVDWKPKFHAADGDGGVDLGDYADLGDYGVADPFEPGPAIPHNPGPGYQALEEEWLREDEAKVPCVAGAANSGYPIVSDNVLDAAGCAIFGECTLLPNHPDYTRYRGQPKQEPLNTERKGTFFLSMVKEDKEFDDGEGGSVTRYRYTIDVWVLADTGSRELEGEELEEYIEEKSGQSTEPSDADKAAAKNCANWVQPHLLNAGADNRMRYIAMVYAELGDEGHPLPFWSNFFSSPPERVYAYAQSQVYNKLSEDMFTQDWRARLEQASLLEAALGGGSKFELGDGNGAVAGALIEPINNH